jgi:hypothetical protein
MMCRLLRFWGVLWGLCAAATAQLSLSFVNHLSSNVTAYAYVTGRDSNNHIVLLQTDYTWYYPAPAQLTTEPTPVPDTVAIPLAAPGTNTAASIPGSLSSGRIWIAQGPLTFSLALDDADEVILIEPSVTDASDPNYLVHWGFVELTYGPDDGLFVNLSYVDFVGVSLGIALESTDGGIQEVLGLPATALTDICRQLDALGGSLPWNQLCVADSTGAIRRILSPNSYITSHPTAFQDFYTHYVDAVWTTYRTQPLTVNSQGASGNITCSVNASTLTCIGDSRDYSEPSAADIFGCNSGPFSIDATDNSIHLKVVPRLCAAFQRGTLLLPGGDQQPGLDPTDYYTTDPNNLYSKFVHELELDGKGYAFAYDDVDPSGADQSGLIASADPQLLTITVGGPAVG